MHIILSKVYYKVEMNKFSQFKNKPLSPDITAVLQTLSRATALKFQEHGGVAANRIGLSTQVPVIHVFIQREDLGKLNCTGKLYVSFAPVV